MHYLLIARIVRILPIDMHFERYLVIDEDQAQHTLVGCMKRGGFGYNRGVGASRGPKSDVTG